MNELRYQATRTFHRAKRVLKFVQIALGHARKNYAAHNAALVQQQEKLQVEKNSKAQVKEHQVKATIRRRERAIDQQKTYATNLEEQALRFSELAQANAKKTAAAGRVAAAKAMESADIWKRLGKPGKDKSTPAAMEALARDNIAALLATKAAKMEHAIVAGGKIPKEVQEFLMDDTGQKMRPSVRKAAHDALLQTHVH